MRWIAAFTTYVINYKAAVNHACRLYVTEEDGSISMCHLHDHKGYIYSAWLMFSFLLTPEAAFIASDYVVTQPEQYIWAWWKYWTLSNRWTIAHHNFYLYDEASDHKVIGVFKKSK